VIDASFVAQLPRDIGDRRTRREQQRGVGVPQIVDANLAQVRAGEQTRQQGANAPLLMHPLVSLSERLSIARDVVVRVGALKTGLTTGCLLGRSCRESSYQLINALSTPQEMLIGSLF
jgi:hypothetical protein